MFQLNDTHGVIKFASGETVSVFTTLTGKMPRELFEALWTRLKPTPGGALHMRVVDKDDKPVIHLFVNPTKSEKADMITEISSIADGLKNLKEEYHLKMWGSGSSEQLVIESVCSDSPNHHVEQQEIDTKCRTRRLNNTQQLRSSF